MKNKDIDDLVRKHKAILGLPQGFGKKSVKDKTTILTGKARSKNPALASYVKEFNDLKSASKETGPSARGGKGGKGGASYTGRQRAEYKKPPAQKKAAGGASKGQPKAPPKPKPPPKKPTPKKPEPDKPKPKPKPKKYETGDDPKFDKDLKDLTKRADDARAKKITKKREDTKIRTEPKGKPRGPRPKKLFTDTGTGTLKKPKGNFSVAEIPSFKPKKSKEPIEQLLDDPKELQGFLDEVVSRRTSKKPTYTKKEEGVAGGATPVPTTKEANEAVANVLNLTLDNVMDTIRTGRGRQDAQFVSFNPETGDIEPRSDTGMSGDPRPFLPQDLSYKILTNDKLFFARGEPDYDEDEFPLPLDSKLGPEGSKYSFDDNILSRKGKKQKKTQTTKLY